MPYTEEQQKMVTALNRCSFLPGTWDKRFVRGLAANADKPMTEKQDEHLRRLFHKYRRQHKGCRCEECRAAQ